MRTLKIKTIYGPSVYHMKPTMVMTLDLEDSRDLASTDIPGFTERLLKLLPDLHEHFCSPGKRGGFVERLQRGTFPAHIIEHITISLSELAGIGVGFGKSVYLGPHGVYQIVVRFKSEEAMKYLLESSVKVFECVKNDVPVDIHEIINEAKAIARDEKLGPSTAAIIEAAEKRNIPWQRLNNESFIQLGYGKYRQFIEATTTSKTADIPVSIAQDKNVTKRFLHDGGIKVPYGVIVESEEELLKAFHSMEGMVAVKPADGNHGRGVSLKLMTDEDVISAFRIARAHSDEVIIEEFFDGQDYRVIVVNGKMIAASHRIPANVTGDGNSTIRQLIEKENKNPLRGVGHEKPLTLISMDEEADFFLKKSGFSLDDIPPQGKVTFLRETANLSTGGIAIDVTDSVHPEVKLMCERAARIVGLDVSGIDLILEDISRSPREQRGGVIEVNAGPGIRMHLYPAEGKPRDVGMAIIDSLFPDNSEGRIPIISITGTNGKTTVTRLVSHLIQSTGKTVGTTTTDGIYVGKNLICEGDTTGPVSAKTILNDPMIEVAVLETARGGIVKRGLGFDWCDIGIITNIQADHIGQDGIETLEDILWVKSLVIERVKKNGTIVLNADSQELRNFIIRRKDILEEGRTLYLYSMENHLEALDILGEKGILFYHQDGNIYELFHGKSQFIVNAKEIPVTMNGTARFQIENIMASIAVCKAYGMSYDEIRAGLSSFQNADNPGRLNLYRVKSGFLLLDYGHNPEAVKNIGEMMKHWDCSKLTAVIAAPGDRSDAMISLSGTAAAEVFDKVIIREDEDKRGRRPGEVPAIISNAAKKSNPSKEILEVHDGVEALYTAINTMGENEGIVYFYEDRDVILEEIRKMGAGRLDHLDIYEGEISL